MKICLNHSDTRGIRNKSYKNQPIINAQDKQRRIGSTIYNGNLGRNICDNKDSTWFNIANDVSFISFFDCDNTISTFL